MFPINAGEPDSVAHRHSSDPVALPQGPSLRSGLCCPGPSTLTRPHPPHSRAHRDFTARRLIRDAFAVRVRLGDPRAVPCFRQSFLLGMSSSKTPGSPPAAFAQFLRRQRWSSPMVDGLDTSNIEPFRGYLLVRSRYDLPSCLPPSRDFYFRASDGSVTLPAAGYHYGVQLGNLHRWDLHPLE